MANLEMLKATMRPTTVDPGQSFGGQITYELPAALRSSIEPVELTIMVRAGGEVHEFKATIVKR